MKKINLTPAAVQTININDVVISSLSDELYDYTNRESEITALVESISQIGQQQPITVDKKDTKYPIVDGVLRYKAMIRLNLNEINVIVCHTDLTDEFSLADLIIHQQIRKQKTSGEKLNEVKRLLRIETEEKNPLRDKERRISLITSLLGGKGWSRSSVLSLEKILLWELKNGTELEISKKIVLNELAVSKGLEAIELIESPNYDRQKEKESEIVKGFVGNKYNAQIALKLMGVYDRKKSEGHTVVETYPKEKGNFKVIQGDIEKIQLPKDLEIDTVFTSPPYYHLVRYGDDPNELGWEKTPEEYINRLSDILMKCYEKLKTTGSMFVNLGETYEDGQCLGITEGLVCELKRRGVRYLDRIIWNKIAAKPTANQVKRLIPVHETILYFAKSKDYYFEKFKVKADRSLKVSRGCKEKGGKKKKFYMPNAYGQFRNILDENEVGTILKVQTHANRTIHVDGEETHPATFSVNLPVIPLLMSTPKNRNSVVFDPFLGSGSCGVAALLLGFKFVGVELYEKNIQTAERTLSDSEEDFDQDSLNSLLEDIVSPDDSEDLLENNQAA